jgi:hypothetical protein
VADRWHSWFASYAPFETANPEEQVVVAVIVEASNPGNGGALRSAIIYQGIFAGQTFEEAVRALGLHISHRFGSGANETETFARNRFRVLFSVLIISLFGVLFIYTSGITSEGVLVSNEHIKQIIWLARERVLHPLGSRGLSQILRFFGIPLFGGPADSRLHAAVRKVVNGRSPG